MIAAIASLVWLALRRRPGDLVLLTGVMAYFAVAGAGESLFVRYAIPLVPLLCVATAAALARLAEDRLVLVVAASLVMTAPTVMAAVEHDRLMTHQDTRELASQWIERQIPSGARIALTGSSYGHPRLFPTRSWVQQRWEDVRRLGEPGKRLRLALDLPGYTSEPAYDLVELQVQPEPGMRSVRDLASVDALRSEGIDWLVTQSHPLPYAAMSASLAADVAALQPIVEFSPGPPHVLAAAAFDPLDAYFLPYSGHRGFLHAGPTLRIYRIATD
jgi:hypothetical protein